VQEAVVAHPEATFVARVCGAYNIVALLSCGSDAGVARFCDEVLRSRPGLQRLESVKILSNRRHDYNVAKIA
jgi:hypothetical protein